MQVKKFEAKTMKEALELVKVHLGPEAIILSAKDSHRGFGLMGERSVEVTAAVSEETLRKKKVAESKLREDLRERFQQIPAARQKQFINRVHADRRENKRELATVGGGSSIESAKPAPMNRAGVSGMRYIDIADEEAPSRLRASEDRVKRAAERALQVGRDVLQDPVVQRAPAVPLQNAQVSALESQVRELKALVEQFQKIPQMSMSMHPGADFGLSFEVSPVYQRLTGQGVQPAIVARMLKKAQREIDIESLRKPALIEAWVVGQLLNSIEVSSAPTKSRYHVFLGSTGQGKTSSLVKLASQLVLKEKQTIAIISLDTIKVGAADQLRIYAQILNVPFAIVRSPEEWRVAEAKLAKVQHILVDSPGFNLQQKEEVEWLRRMLPPPEFDQSRHYVQSALARDEDALDLAARFQMIGFNDVIFTRLDESSRQGLLLNFQEKFNKPLHSFGTGSRIPEDFEFASKERVIDFLFKLSKFGKKEESL
jgi:flagellar biosynthesis protein FlhF